MLCCTCIYIALWILILPILCYLPGPPDNDNRKVISVFVIRVFFLVHTELISLFVNSESRTIINGLCYLATFVFGVNSVGLFLYSGQLFFKSFMEGPGSEGEPPSSNLKSDDMNSSTITNSGEDQSSEDAQ